MKSLLEVIVLTNLFLILMSIRQNQLRFFTSLLLISMTIHLNGLEQDKIEKVHFFLNLGLVEDQP